MRWALLVFLVANMVFAGYQWARPVGGASVEPPAYRQEGARLQLLSEVPAQELGRDSAFSGGADGDDSDGNADAVAGGDEANAGEPRVVEEEPVSALCTLVGPFSALLRAEYFLEHLAEEGIVSQITEIEVPGPPAFWVYLSPLESRSLAYQKLGELQREGIDSYVIPKGELENGISFGLFSQEVGGLQRLKEIKALGYPAALKRVERSNTEIWVSIGAYEAKKITQQQWLTLLVRDEALEMRQNFCPAVASE